MPRDYKARANPRPSRRPTPCWVWFGAGLVLGAFGFGLAWLKLGGGAGGTILSIPGLQQPAAKPQASRQQEPEPAASRPRFDFYTILPEMEVVVPDPEPLPAPAPAPQTPRTIAEQKPQSSERYMLQMGSFRKFADADRLKASLALVGIEAEIQKVSINRGEIFYRVRSGPYSRDKVNSLSGRLKTNKINSLVIKLKQ
jgi:cell division protein FtsN